MNIPPPSRRNVIWIAVILCIVGAMLWRSFFPSLPFNIPESAKNIKINTYEFWQAYLCEVRFEYSSEMCISLARNIINDPENQQMFEFLGTNSETKTIDIDAGHFSPLPISAKYHADWFRPDTIRKGVYMGNRGTMLPQIWIDMENNIFYFQMTD